jgi:hypothetical protein
MDTMELVREHCASLTGKVIAPPIEIRPKVITYSQPASLTDETLSTLKAFFEAHDNRPSEQMWIALRALAATLEKMAEGKCEPQLFLSSLDPGVGKSQCIVHFVKALMRSEAHKDVGVLVCVGRLNA